MMEEEGEGGVEDASIIFRFRFVSMGWDLISLGRRDFRKTDRERTWGTERKTWYDEKRRNEKQKKERERERERERLYARRGEEKREKTKEQTRRWTERERENKGRRDYWDAKKEKDRKDVEERRKGEGKIQKIEKAKVRSSVKLEQSWRVETEDEVEGEIRDENDHLCTSLECFA